MRRFNSNGGAVKALCRFKFMPAVLLALVTLLFASTAPAAELVVNGGFEVPDIINGEPGTPPYVPSTRAVDKGWTTFYGQNYTDDCSANAWEQECSGGYLIPGWDVWWTDTLLIPNPDYDPDPNSPDHDPVEFLALPPGDAMPGRIEIQNDWLPTWVNPLIPGWNIDRANEDPPLPPIVPISYAMFGEQKAELDSHDRYDQTTGELLENHNVSVAQTLLTCPNQRYVLTYSWRSRTTDDGDNDVRVVVASTVVRVNKLTADWVEETVRFVSDDTYETDIAFISIGTGTTRGMSLDGVSVIGPTPDAFGTCPPPPICTDDDESIDACEIPDGSSDDGSSEDGTSGDGTSGDGTSGDGTSGDGTSGDGTSGDGTSGDDGSSDDGSSDDGECGICSDKLDTLTLVYDGDDFTSHGQSDDKSSVDPLIPDHALPVEARIFVYNDKNDDVLFSGNVRIGDAFTFEPENSLRIEILDGNTVVQTITFHASCSQPLDRLDTFGGITIWDATNDDDGSKD